METVVEVEDVEEEAAVVEVVEVAKYLSARP